MVIYLWTTPSASNMTTVPHHGISAVCQSPAVVCGETCHHVSGLVGCVVLRY